MGILGRLLGRRRTIKDIPSSQLQEEKIKLEEKEKQLINRLEKIEQQKADLFKKGASESSRQRRIVLGRKIKELDERINELSNKQKLASMQIRAVHRIITVKANEGVLKKKGLWSVVQKMTPEALEDWAAKAVVRDRAQAENLNRILETIGASPESYEVIEEEKDIMDVVRAMEKAGETGQVENEYERLEQQKAEENKEKEA